MQVICERLFSLVSIKLIPRKLCWSDQSIKCDYLIYPSNTHSTYKHKIILSGYHVSLFLTLKSILHATPDRPKWLEWM